MSKKIKVMMATEGTYPFHNGGVSTWCDILVNGKHDNIDMHLYSVIMNPYVTQKFNLPKDTELIKVPLWGTEEPSEHLDLPFSKVYDQKTKTTESVVINQFIPLFKDLIDEILYVNKNPKKFGITLYHLYEYFQKYDYRESFKSERTWEFFKQYIYEFTADEKNGMQMPASYSLIQSIGWIYRFMTVLNTPVPPVDVSHSVAAAFCGIPCVIAKFEYNAPFLLTEHGIYLREQYLSLAKREYPPYLNTFLIRMIHSVVALNYYYADQVSPVCYYNTRWEQRFGVTEDKIRVIYNGVDEKVFAPPLVPIKNDDVIIASVARIDPVKDIFTLLKAASLVLNEVERVKFVVFGSVTVESYYEECLALKSELNLGDRFEFAGHTNDIASVYKNADIIALSSISEAFPYSVVEAMMTGKPVVSTDVGGVKEALGGYGIVIPPRNPEMLAEELIKLVRNKSLRESLGADGRERALNLFTVGIARQQYYDSYISLAMRNQQRSEEKTVANITYMAEQLQLLLIDKAFALFNLGHYEDAITQWRQAVKADPKSPKVTEIFKKISEAYCYLGNPFMAAVEIERADLLSKIG